MREMLFTALKAKKATRVHQTPAKPQLFFLTAWRIPSIKGIATAMILHINGDRRACTLTVLNGP